MMLMFKIINIVKNIMRDQSHHHRHVYELTSSSVWKYGITSPSSVTRLLIRMITMIRMMTLIRMMTMTRITMMIMMITMIMMVTMITMVTMIGITVRATLMIKTTMMRMMTTIARTTMMISVVKDLERMMI